MKWKLIVLAGAAAFALALAGGALYHARAQGPQSAPATKAPRKVTMEELHRSGGVPRGWAFTLPPGGDAARGRQLFRELECYKCHAVAGENLPAAAADGKNAGPELTGMGTHHPAEYFAESILWPNAVILEGPGYTGDDGLSIMPSYAESLSVPQLLDLVAYLKSLTAGGGHKHHATGDAAREKVIGEYRIRVAYAGPDDARAGHEGHQHGAAGGGPGGPPSRAPAAPSAGAAKPPTGHLAVFITSADTGEAVPYLPVRATFFVAGKPPRTVKLNPMLDASGLHYGADVTIPEGTDTVRFTIGAVTVQAMPSAKGRFSTPTTAVFEWR
ncbi:MAG TPA: c-type cytochrome [Methylomirabilota bacterium]|jgi:mono/diheme cytochrome c family protein